MSVTRHRYYFRTMVQGRNEKVCEWEMRLRKQAAYCNFESVDEQIFDQIVEKSNLIVLRREALRIERDLSQLLNLAANLENVEKNCTRCGAEDHRFFSAVCPALSSKCRTCKVIGHYAKYCFRNIPKRKNMMPFKEETKKFKADKNLAGNYDLREETPEISQIVSAVVKEPVSNIPKDPRLIKTEIPE